jgi:glycine cleavage system T protein
MTKSEKTARRTPFFFPWDVQEFDPEASEILRLEEERQARKIILIASESICPAPVRETLSCVFSNIYAEGYPHMRMSKDERDLLLDFERQMAYHRRYSDKRYYKGTEYVDFIEALAQRRCAELFATPEVPAQDIFVNVQPLSGAAANNAVYNAFLRPGDTVMGMNLTHGGHLTHGSPVNRSGKNYNVVSYGVSQATGRLDYGAVQRLAEETRPRLIIAGYSAYPWAIDWARFREIADSVPGCRLLADIAHPAGLVVAGLFPNPVPYADAVTFTTHKTMCGPRGAVALTRNERAAKLIDLGVFPGEQGGPHIHTVAAKAVAFKIAASREFRDLQKRIAENASHLGKALQDLGLTLAYGGTESHMVLLDLRGIPTDTGYPLRAEVVTRILDHCGLTCNKNTIAGDTNALYPSGVRFGTTWVTQRGMRKKDMEKIASLVHRAVTNMKPFDYIGTVDVLGRCKMDMDVLESIKTEVAELESRFPREFESGRSNTGYPHYFGARKSEARKTALHPVHARLKAKMVSPHGVKIPAHYKKEAEELENAMNTAVIMDEGDRGLLEVSGDWDRVRPFMEQVCTASIHQLKPGRCMHTLLLDKDGNILDDAVVLKTKGDRRGVERYILSTHAANSERVKLWLRHLSDGYIIFDDQDIFRKVEGPVVVRDLGCPEDGEDVLTCLSLDGPEVPKVLAKVDGNLKTLRNTHWIHMKDNGFAARADWPSGIPRVLFFVPESEVEDFWARTIKVLKRAGGLPAGLSTREALRVESQLPLFTGESDRKPTEDILKNRDLFHIEKPYFVGQDVLPQDWSGGIKQEYEIVAPEMEMRRTPLNELHHELGGRMVPFAGWEMPVWYKGLREEHEAVRETAGLFDVSHMGVLEVSGDDATAFLNAVCTNYLGFCKVGQSMYAYLLDPDGEVVDDIMIYRREPNKYLVVVNAVNAEKDLEWLRAVNSKKFIIDRFNPVMELPGKARIRDLRAKSSGKARRIDLALQGPESLRTLLELTDDPVVRRALSELDRSQFVETRLMGVDVIVSRTGYTGEDMGYELYLHPDESVGLFRSILEVGEKFGVKPVGLAARDSTRTEAGFPLYGNELAGHFGVTPIEAGYGSFVKLHKPFFIGRSALMRRMKESRETIVRFRVEARRARALKTDDPVTNDRGDHVGFVTSCTPIQGTQVGMAYVDRKSSGEGTRLMVFPLPKDRFPEKSKHDLKRGDRTVLPVPAVVIPRFLLAPDGVVQED